MTSEVRIVPILSLSEEEILPLASVAEAEGYWFIRRLAEEWASGEQRFSKEGEILFGAYAEKELVGVGGLTHDPFTSQAGVGRVRRMYVRPDWRGEGIGRTLVQAVISAAQGSFQEVTLYAENPGAIALYESLGFEPVYEGKVTHRMRLVRPSASCGG